VGITVTVAIAVGVTSVTGDEHAASMKLTKRRIKRERKGKRTEDGRRRTKDEGRRAKRKEHEIPNPKPQIPITNLPVTNHQPLTTNNQQPIHASRVTDHF
jgi:hypothetical protein